MKPITRKEAKDQGLKYYFTGEPCIHGHIEERQVGNNGCRICLREYHTKWVERNPEKVIKMRKVYYDKNAEKLLAYAKKCRIDNIEKFRKRDLERNKKRMKATRESAANKVSELSSSYVKSKILRQYGLTADQVTDELVEVKREQLKQFRLLKEISDGINITTG